MSAREKDEAVDRRLDSVSSSRTPGKAEDGGNTQPKRRLIIWGHDKSHIRSNSKHTHTECKETTEKIAKSIGKLGTSHHEYWRPQVIFMRSDPDRPTDPDFCSTETAESINQFISSDLTGQLANRSPNWKQFIPQSPDSLTEELRLGKLRSLLLKYLTTVSRNDIQTVMVMAILKDQGAFEDFVHELTKKREKLNSNKRPFVALFESKEDGQLWGQNNSVDPNAWNLVQCYTGG